MLTNGRSRFPVSLLVRAAWVVGVWATLPLLLGIFLIYGSYQAILPPIPDIMAHTDVAASRIFTLDGREVGGLARGAMHWAPYEEIPAVTVLAFLAAEDDDFFLHEGVDVRAIVRAAWVNLWAGETRQGGSTITQQLAKMFVGQARSYERKLVELLFARRIEGLYSKTEILEAYLNRVYLGAGATGVVAAAHIYFDRSLGALTLGQSALLAGIASAPSAFDPYDAPEVATERRNRVLARMGELGFVDAQQAQAAMSEPVSLRRRGEVPEETMPYVTDAIRGQLLEQFGPEAWATAGLTAWTGASPSLSRQSDEALYAGVAEVDRRQGYRGPLYRGSEVANPLSTELFDALVAATFGVPGDGPRPALVQEVDSDALQVWVDGASQRLEGEAWRWAFTYDESDPENSRERDDATGLAAPGDIVLVEPGAEGAYRLTQTPRLQGALLAVDLDSHYVLAMAAGIDHDLSQFNRVTRGCRQPGSVFKPVVYSAALDMGETLASRLLDAPLQIWESAGEVWRPRNADGDFRGALGLRDALVLSRNLPTVRLFELVGARRVIERAQALGITTPMEAVDALSLGASCVLPIDVSTAYAVFATRGYRHRPVTLVAVTDAAGQLRLDEGAFHDGAASAGAVLFRLRRDVAERERPVINTATAYLMTYTLHDVVEMGTGFAASRLGFPAAGKTGTTTAFDGWFVGYTESVLTTVWVGSDVNTRPLGRGETGGETALPIWLAFMRTALSGRTQGSLTEDPPAGIEVVRIDQETGLLSPEGDPGVWLPFRAGSAPEEYAPSEDARDMRRVDRVEDEF